MELNSAVGITKTDRRKQSFLIRTEGSGHVAAKQQVQLYKVVGGDLSQRSATEVNSRSFLNRLFPANGPVPGPPVTHAATIEAFSIRQYRPRRTAEEISAENCRRRRYTAEEKALRNAKQKQKRDARTPEEVERDNAKKRQRRLEKSRLQKVEILDAPEPHKPQPLNAVKGRKKAWKDPRETRSLKLCDPEQAKQIRDARTISLLNRKAAMTEEELKEHRRKKYFQELARKGNMTREEKADYARRAKEQHRKYYDSMGEEKYKRHLSNIQNWLKRRNQKLKEEDPEQYKALQKRNYDRFRASMKNWTEEDWKRQRIRYRISQKLIKLKQDKLKERWSEEEFTGRVEEMKTTLWKELYPDGKPPLKPRGVKRVKEPFKETPPDQFICLKCFPQWNEEKNVWKPLGFKTKIQLLRHVRLRHKRFFFACSYCEILKYSKFSLDVHLKVCLKHKSS